MSSQASQVVRRGNTFTWLARLIAVDQQNIVQSDYTSLTWELWKISQGKKTRLVEPTALVIADVIFNTLQTDYGWTQDSTGYNFRLTVPGSDTDDGPSLVVVLRSVDGDGYDAVIELPFSTEEVP